MQVGLYSKSCCINIYIRGNIDSNGKKSTEIQQKLLQNQRPAITLHKR